MEHITILCDKKATRTAIIQEFKNLADDPRIVRGQAIIIIYFAGHGAAADKPKEWSDWQSSDNKIEMLCPSDMGLPDGEKSVIEGIPDRTISQLLTVISNAKGNNIVRTKSKYIIDTNFFTFQTLILDCCHSAGINRGGGDAPNTRSRQLFKPPKISPDCDSTIRSFVPTSQVVPVASGFSGTPWDSHILLAACSRLQTAKEVDGKGLFTQALLKVMRERNVARGELTYKSLMHCLDMPSRKYVFLCLTSIFVEQLLSQTPHLEGKHIHQSVFSLWKDIPNGLRTACSYDSKSKIFSLQAGLIHGVTVGSTFHIYPTDRVSDPAKPITSATVTAVGSFASWLKPPSSFVESKKQQLWYAQLTILKSDSRFVIYCNNPTLLTGVLGDNTPKLLLAATTVTDKDEADLCLMVDREGKGDRDGRSVFFDRGDRNPFLSPKSTGLPSHLQLSQISIKVDDIPRIRNIINHYAHFTAHLGSTLTVGPRNQVRLYRNEKTRYKHVNTDRP